MGIFFIKLVQTKMDIKNAIDKFGKKIIFQNNGMSFSKLALTQALMNATSKYNADLGPVL